MLGKREASLSGNPASRVRIDIRDEKDGDADEHRVGQAVELGDPDPLGCVVELLRSDAEEVASNDCQGAHDLGTCVREVGSSSTDVAIRNGEPSELLRR